MANTFLDSIREGNAALLQPQGITGETERVRKLIQGRRGRVTGPDITASSNVGEQIAQVEGARQLQEEVAPKLQQQQQKLVQDQASLEAQERDARADISQQRKFNTLSSRVQVTRLLADLEREKGRLNSDQNQARLEQAGFLLSIQDSKYMNELQDAGRRRRLDDETNTRRELLELAYGSSLNLLNSKLAGADMLSASKRQFKGMLASMDINSAIELARLDSEHRANINRDIMDAMRQGLTSQAAVQAAANRYTGGTTILSSGLKAWDKSQDKKDEKDEK